MISSSTTTEAKISSKKSQVVSMVFSFPTTEKNCFFGVIMKYQSCSSENGRFSLIAMKMRFKQLSGFLLLSRTYFGTETTSTYSFRQKIKSSFLSLIHATGEYT